MTYQYKIRSVDLSSGTFVVQFDGLQPLNFWIPHNDSGFLVGAELDQAIQALYPWEVQQAEKFAVFTNGAAIESLVEPAPIPKQTEDQIRQQRNTALLRSDWTQLADADLTAEQKAAWAKYRQELRDLPSQSGFPDSVEFPVVPA